MRARTALTGVVALTLAGGGGSARAQQTDWQRAHRLDVEWVYETLRDNHPGAVDPENRAFRASLDRGRARERAARVRDQAGYIYSLQRFVVGLGDTHTTLSVDFSGVPARWAGLVVRADGERAVVVDRDSTTSAPPIGARVVSCDGAPFRSLVDRVLAFQGHPRSHARRRFATTWAFVDGSNPFSPPPTSCLFESGGRRSVHRLRWRPFDPKTFERLIGATRLESATLGMSEIGPGVFWIGLPSFASRSPELRLVVDSIVAAAPVLRSARAVIFDVRGNGGGSSVWGNEIVRALWGDGPADSVEGSAVDWRASPANADFIASVRADLVKNGGSPVVLDLLERVETGMRASIASGRPYWRQEGRAGPSGGLTRRRPTGPGTIPARVALLTDDGCSSACLDFADLVLARPGVTHLGMITNGDNLYIEKRNPVTSPSGMARLDHSLKVYRGRPRGDMESYTPDRPYDGEWSTRSLQRWVLRLVADGRLTGKAGGP